MFKYVLIVLAVLAIGALVVFTLFNRSEPVSGVSLETIQTDIANGAVLVDVRTPEEYRAEHAVNSVNVPLQNMQNGNFGQLSPDQKTYLYCRSGSRSAEAENLLRQANYNDVVDIRTLSEWKALGGQVTQG